MSTSRTTRRTFAGLSAAALSWALARSTPLVLSRSAILQTQPVALTGRVIWPQNPEYDAARQTFNVRISRFPAAIVVCANEEDAQNAVRWARQQGIPLRARSGGHSYEGFSSVDGGLVIDVSGLNGITVDVARREATVGAGVKLLDLYRQLWQYGLTLSAGTCPSVGIAGLTLGGGFGFLSRQDGLTCDNLRAVALVDANGDLLRADERDHPDLFWALRGGGGGNFGIATAFTFRVRPIAEVAVFDLTWPWDEVAEVLDVWQRWAPFADQRLVAELIVPASGAGIIRATGQFIGPAGELWPLLEPLLRAATPGTQNVQSVPFITAAEQFGGPPITQSRFKNTGAFAYQPFTPEAIATFVAHMRASPTAANVTGLYPFGGVIAAVAPASTAFVHRRALFSLQYQAYWDDATNEAEDLAWVRDLRTAMLPYTSGAYVNFVDTGIADWATAYYGSNLARLIAVKTRYDPDDVFNGPQSIPRAPA